MPEEGGDLSKNKDQNLELKFLGFEKSLKRLREHSEQAVSSLARTSLPFPVQSHIMQKCNMAWSDSAALIVYVDLKAFLEDYALANDTDSFQMH